MWTFVIDLSEDSKSVSDMKAQDRQLRLNKHSSPKYWSPSSYNCNVIEIQIQYTYNKEGKQRVLFAGVFYPNYDVLIDVYYTADRWIAVGA